MTTEASEAMVHTRRTLARAQQVFGDWALALLRSSGAQPQGLAVGFPPEEGSWVLLLPLRVGTPGRSLDGGGASLLAAPDSSREGPRHLSGAWTDFGRAFQLATDELLPRLDPRTHRPCLPPLVDDLPASLARWYRQAGPDWILEEGGRLRARPPSLSWSAGTTLRVDYLLTVRAPGPEVIPWMGVLAAGLIRESGMDVPVDPTSLDGPLLDYVQALDQTPPGAGLRARAEQALLPGTARAAIGFASDLSPNEIARIMAHYQATSYPYLTPALQILAGSQLSFAPAAFPSISGRPRSEG